MFGHSISQRKLAALLSASIILLTSCSGGKQVRFTSLFKDDDETTAATAIAKIERTYQIKPDRRYLIALSDLAFILQGKRIGKVEAEFVGGKWQIRAEKIVISEIEDNPTYDQICNSLLSFVQKLEGKEGAYWLPEKGKSAYTAELNEKVKRLLVDYSPNSLIYALALLNDQWRAQGGTQRSVDYAATALTSLFFQANDRAGAADDLGGRALAFVVLGKRYATEHALSNSIRLAEAMGYHAEASRLSWDLSKENPLRMYVMYQAETLGSAITQGIDSNETKFLYMKKLAQSEKIDELKRILATAFPPNATVAKIDIPANELVMGNLKPLALPIAGCLQPLKDSSLLPADFFEAELYLADNLRSISKLKDKGESAAEAEDPLFEKLGTYVNALDVCDKDKVFSNALIATFYRSFAYSEGLNELYLPNGSYVKKDAAETFKKQFGDTKNKKDFGFEFEKFAQNIIDSRNGNYHVSEVLGHVAADNDFGAGPRFIAIDETARWFAPGEFKILSAGKTLFANIDSRPSSRFYLSNFAHDELLHPLLGVALGESALKANPDVPETVEVAKQLSNREFLRQMSVNKTYAPSQRANALSSLFDLVGIRETGVRDDIVAKARQIVDENPGNIVVLQHYVNIAKKLGLQIDAIAVTKSWLATASARGTKVEEAYPEKAIFKAKELLVSLYAKNGQPEKALEVPGGKIVPESSHDAATSYINSILAAKKDPQSASMFADLYYESNRISPSALALKARILWQNKTYDKAAKLLREYPWCIKVENWRDDLYPAFRAALQESPNEMSSAVRALAKESFVESSNFGELAKSFANHGKVDVAFSLLDSMLKTSFSGNELNFLNLATQAYVYLREMKGEKAALAWVQDKVPPQFYTPTAMYAVQNGAYDLLWTLLPKRPEGVGSEYVWMARAATVPLQKELSAEDNKLLIEHFSKIDLDPMFLIGKSMLGATDPNKLLDVHMNVREIGDLAYYLGFRDAHMGDQPKAAEWYHLALETGVNKASETARNAEAIRQLNQYYPEWNTQAQILK